MSRRPPTKEGTALIIALGFLALLTVMILAFAARSRTDRLAGRNYLENARATQMLHTALADAMENIDVAFGTNYPARLAFGSGDGSGFPIAGNVNLSTEENYLPLGNHSIRTAYEKAWSTAEWIPVSADNTEIGRIAYVVVNTSGLLDANSIGDAETRRRNGRSPEEIKLSHELLDELNTSAQLIDADGNAVPAPDAGTALIHNRDTAWKRFESLRDIKTLNSSERGSAIGGDIASFNTFSLYPSNRTEHLLLTENTDADEFEQMLTEQCGFSDDETEHIVNNYFDYIDADSVPRALDGSSPEAVPMINEIRLDNVVFDHNVIDPTNVHYEISGELYVETWYPFSNDVPDDAFMEIFAANISTTPDSKSGNLEILDGEEYAGQSLYTTLVVSYTNMSKAIIFPLTEYASNTDGAFTEYLFEFNYDETLELKTAFYEGEATDPVKLFFLNESIEINFDEPVDRVEDIELELPVSESGSDSTVAYSCRDPRINHDFLADWQEQDSTPHAVNAIEDWGEEADLIDKNSILFYCANRPMTNTAELGFLSTGEPWDTVRLYAAGETPDPVLDYFHTPEDLTHAPIGPGYININSPHSNVLATAFWQAPLGDSRAITAGQAEILGANLARATNPEWKNRSHAGYALADNLPDWNLLTDAQKESLVANTYRLFGWRDTSYTILLLAQTGTDIDNNGLKDEEIRASRQAVVQIWRDPLTEAAAVTFFGLSDTLRNDVDGGADSWGTLLNAFAP
ncbi:hypothetical protein [Pontiella agarivorans]|uniref:Uncharacterized protein n=1 Tax=Pontiella agarivorans TaxID=3038953 RepID=A0ABU5MUH3_9BACT|nr:hypothetical protein [Pontiella agarivorans]MDZ8117874.1 hypothetical protein [Pontiella agarivorans]